MVSGGIVVISDARRSGGVVSHIISERHISARSYHARIMHISYQNGTFLIAHIMRVSCAFGRALISYAYRNHITHERRLLRVECVSCVYLACIAQCVSCVLVICVRAYRGFVSCTYHSCIVYVSCYDTIVVDLLRYIRDTNFDTASGYLVDFWEEVPEISQAYQDITCIGCRHDTARIV